MGFWELVGAIIVGGIALALLNLVGGIILTWLFGE